MAGSPEAEQGTGAAGLPMRVRIIAVAVATAVLATVAVVYTVTAVQRTEAADAPSAFGLDHGRLYFRSTREGAGAGRVARLAAAPGPETAGMRAAAAPGPDLYAALTQRWPYESDAYGLSG
ncbi:hypothetical protein ABZ637_16330, partial [Streptomyces sp. NPDC007100]